MVLDKELGLKHGIKLLEHEAILNIYYTASVIRKYATEFFRKYGLTDVQFNVLALLAYQAVDQGGLSQATLSEMMLVNRANVTSLVDRMEKAGLVKRTAAVGDRRSNIIVMTEKGKKLHKQVEPLYEKRVKEVMSTVAAADQKKLIAVLEKIRSSF